MFQGNSNGHCEECVLLRQEMNLHSREISDLHRLKAKVGELNDKFEKENQILKAENQMLKAELAAQRDVIDSLKLSSGGRPTRNNPEKVLLRHGDTTLNIKNPALKQEHSGDLFRNQGTYLSTLFAKIIEN